MTGSYRRVHVSAGEWELADVAVAVGFLQRLRGITARDVDAILLRGASVHTFWLRSPIRVCAIDAEGLVLDHHIVRPYRLWWTSRAMWLLEFDPSHACPGIGVRLTVASSDNARNAHRVRNTHRKPR